MIVVAIAKSLNDTILRYSYPLLCAAFTAIYHVGCYLYQAGYADTSSDVKMARHKKGGPIKYIGMFGNLVCAVLVAGNIEGWW